MSSSILSPNDMPYERVEPASPSYMSIFCRRHPVIEAILARAATGSLPGQRLDSNKIALVIEGGNMRGVVSAGMVTALEYLSLLQTFDVVYGTSAGAINGAYFLAGQAAYGTTIYYEDINNSQFIDFYRALSNTPVVSLDYLLYDVMTYTKVLDWRRVVDSPIPLVPIATSVTRLGRMALEISSHRTLLGALRASACIPILAGGTVQFGDDTFLDGSITEAIPFHAAVADGCTHILALCTQPSGVKTTERSFFDQCIMPPILRRYNADLPDTLIATRLGHYSSDLNILDYQTSECDGPPFLCAIKIPREQKVSRLEQRRNRLLAGARAGMTAVFDQFGYTTPEIVEVLRPFSKKHHPNFRAARGAICFED